MNSTYFDLSPSPLLVQCLHPYFSQYRVRVVLWEDVRRCMLCSIQIDLCREELLESMLAKVNRSAKLHERGPRVGPKLQNRCYFDAGHHGGSECR